MLLVNKDFQFNTYDMDATIL